ncbi:MAG: 3-oxoacyl-ACP synthase III [Lentisphaeraceae bacterium]|nr:3-oxoacyl-ACP synthase III [Lentisphaeraceae bacterium]
MINKNVCIEGFEAYLPESIITSEEVEDLLSPAYQKLRLPKGRLELFTGIKERRYWPETTKPSDVSTKAGQQILDKLNIDNSEIDALIHCSVCRDFLAPATASVVHSKLKLPNHAINFDISNACLGMLTGIGVLADMIESGRIKRGLLVAGEIGFPLLKQTIAHLNSDTNLTRQSFKPHFASLTIGSAAAAIVVSHKDVAKNDSPSLISSASYSHTQHNHLCQGTLASGMGENSAPLMHTDSEALLHKGIETAGYCWEEFSKEIPWNAQEFDRCCTHQVGTAHSKLLFDKINLKPKLDYITFPHYGNCGSASLPLTAALAAENKHFEKGHKVALLGIGSGINCNMTALKW